MNAIEIAGLSKTYTGKKWTRVDALKNLSLEVAQGEIFGFLGPNGAGKSTTIKTLLGLIRPSSGSARLMGEDIGTAAARKHVGYLPENPAFYDYLNAEEYLLFVGRSFGMPEGLLGQRCAEVLQRLQLWDARKRPMRSYSKGMVQRVGIAQVLIHDPEVYILDEPMSGLDPVGRALVKEIMTELKQRGKCVFFSTHIVSDVESVCDRVGIITKGELRSVERVEAVLERGVVGYQLTLKDREGSRELYVPREQLTTTVGELAVQGVEITLLEPRRKSLEDFFLEIVTGTAV
ncbi:ABC transporter ATP-binding protein [Geomonas limicola]|uniref:ABC transporter ATP-binding protein n=1 Tax=Geomonas limicola TaxID=2740186 RepID=A0A6V8N303_9BACT|nr:ABC transporter ATP-binding protein [Geomonas limicola]GFO66740.1 ABC transporter ATP-binding protein [Geomonas limicola]